MQKEKPSIVKNKPSGDDPVIDIIMGRDHSIFVTERGFLYSIGRNSEGQRGLGQQRYWGQYRGFWKEREQFKRSVVYII